MHPALVSLVTPTCDRQGEERTYCLPRLRLQLCGLSQARATPAPRTHTHRPERRSPSICASTAHRRRTVWRDDRLPDKRERRRRATASTDAARTQAKEARYATSFE